MSEINIQKPPKKNISNDKFVKDLKNVQDHYLDYPYPFRDPKDESKGMLRIQGDFLCEINHYLYKGKKNFDNFRVLVAGGGTGDSTLWLARQLMEYTNTEVVYLDFSKNSMKIAKERAKFHKITNITWVEDSILNIPKLKDLGKFDYVNCTGVLHHLSDPDAGLKILADVIKDDGGAGIMLYALYGRTGVYQIQELLKRTNEGISNRQEEVKNSWDIINSLPQTNWYIRGKELLADHVLFGDVGLYDMFLHKQDRAYSVEQMYEYFDKVKMHMVEYTDPYSRAVLNIDSYFTGELANSPAKERIANMPRRKREAIAELMGGNIIKHSVLISKREDSAADIDDIENMVPFIFDSNKICDEIFEFIDSKENAVMNQRFNYQIQDSIKRTMNVVLFVFPHTKYFFKYLKDGKYTFKEIYDKVRKETKTTASDEELHREFKLNFNSLLMLNKMHLRDKAVKPFNNFIQLSR